MLNLLVSVILSFVIIFSFSELHGSEIAFEKITSKNGLSQNDVIGIYKDKTGYMWFCTQDGLNRYDGYDFEVFRVSSDKNSISGNLLLKVEEDYSNNIWIATQNKGISVLNKITGEITTFCNSDEYPDIITDNNVLDIICDSHNRIIATTQTGINIFSQNGAGQLNIQKFRNINLVYDNNLARNYGKIIETHSGEFLMCSFDAIFKLETNANGEFTGKADKVFAHDDYDGYHNIIEVDNGFIVGVWFDIIYVEYNKSNDKYLFHSKTANVNNSSFALDANNNLWTGGSNGLSYFVKNKSDGFPYSLKYNFKAGDTDFHLSNDFVRDIFIDNNHTVWIGTNGGGINKYDPNKRQFRSYNKNSQSGCISHSKVLSFFEDSDSNLWVGTEGGGVNLLPATMQKNYTFGFIELNVNDKQYQNYAYDILEIKEGKNKRIVVATAYPSLLVDFKFEDGKWIKTNSDIDFKSIVLALCYDSENVLWVATYNDGIYKIRNYLGARTIEHYNTENSKLPSNTIRSILEDSQNRIWIGTAEGLIMINRAQRVSENLEFTLFKNIPGDNTSLSYNYIMPIIETVNSEIWVGTYGGGVNIYKEGRNGAAGYFDHFSIGEGLPNPVVKDIVEDKSGNIWISTNNGLSCHSCTNNTLVNYGISDGLQDNEFTDRSGYMLSDGEILFGGVSGFNAFYPEEISEDTLAPVVVFNNIEIENALVKPGQKYDGRIILNQALNYTNKLQLKYHENNFKISFSALHYTSPESNQFVYMLKGFDNDWIWTTSELRFAKYTNMSPGKYTFMLRAANCDGVWSGEPRIIEIEITEPFWRTLFFKIVSVSLLLIIAFVYFMARIVSEKQKNAVLESEVKKRTLEISKQNSVLQQTNVLLEEQKEEIEANKEELEQHKENLEKMVLDRTEELLIALEKAQESDKLKTAFFANLSHEIRTPMNAIIGFSNLLNTIDVEETERRRYLNIIEANTKTLLALIDVMLDLSLIESKQMKLQIEKFELNKLIDNLFSFYKMKHNSTNVELKLNNSVYEKNIILNTDYTRVNQIITNFMNNALKFTKEGFVELSVYTDGTIVKISVKDTGRGIPANKLQYIFKRFAQVEDGYNKSVEGLGLGLSISEMIAHELGGSITVTSEEGKGSEFVFGISIGGL